MKIDDGLLKRVFGSTEGTAQGFLNFWRRYIDSSYATYQYADDAWQELERLAFERECSGNYDSWPYAA